MKKVFKFISEKIKNTGNKVAAVVSDTRGELATNTIGGIIVGVVIIGLLIMAISQFFPGFFSDMFDSMAEKLNANW